MNNGFTVVYHNSQTNPKHNIPISYEDRSNAQHTNHLWRLIQSTTLKTDPKHNSEDRSKAQLWKPIQSTTLKTNPKHNITLNTQSFIFEGHKFQDFHRKVFSKVLQFEDQKIHKKKGVSSFNCFSWPAKKHEDQFLTNRINPAVAFFNTIASFCSLMLQLKLNFYIANVQQYKCATVISFVIQSHAHAYTLTHLHTYTLTRVHTHVRTFAHINIPLFCLFLFYFSYSNFLLDLAIETNFPFRPPFCQTSCWFFKENSTLHVTFLYCY